MYFPKTFFTEKAAVCNDYYSQTTTYCTYFDLLEISHKYYPLNYLKNKRIRPTRYFYYKQPKISVKFIFHIFTYSAH